MARRQYNPGQRPRTSSGVNNPTPSQLPQQHQSATTSAGFINPYNFVRFLSTVVRTESSDLNSPPLRTHEKFSGLSGCITVEMTTVTPLCIPDAEATTATYVNNDPERPRYNKPFCRVNGNPYIPGSAIKGMLRNVALVLWWR